ncbi:hypothetical protein AA0229_1851 [Gluconobacter cerinus NRIC 0229]|uniref:Uncharacterized protein n=1 Tax=Gluconobacter cerinus TaxID=38307 RepID=A0AAV5NC73_9PROT|nr:hypothetical protein AA0229_1851 [Gluconobacter cerinus NRIC 0229]GLQ61528.1 hypothetical protein GCM10007867_03730 [Gluconobacter cerinus]
MNVDIEYVKQALKCPNHHISYEIDDDGTFLIKNASHLPGFNSQSLVDLVLKGWLYSYEHDSLLKRV